jgi:Na+/proline symporter
LAGGFHSVVSTDAVQGLILFAGGMLLPLTMIARQGGLGSILEAVREAEPAALNWTGDMPLVTMVGLALGVGLKFVVEPRQLSRFYGLASDEQLRRGRWIAPSLLFLTYLGMLPVGFFAHAFVGSENVMNNSTGRIDTDLVIPWLLGSEGNLLGPVGGAFFLPALVAAAMSSLDSVLLVAASSIDHDLIAPQRNSLKKMRLTRMWVLVLSLVAAGLSICLEQGIVEMSSFSGSMYAACFLPTLVVGLFWKRGTPAGAMAALIVGFSVTLTWFCLKKQIAGGTFQTWHEVYVGTTASLSIYACVSILTRSATSSSSLTENND